MTFTTRLTNVRYRREHVDERTGMCYHQTPPSERVVMHVRDAGQAKPRLEHHPLSLLGACYATPRRKLNDPANGYRRFTIDAQALDPSRCRGVGILFLMLAKIASVSLIFFCGLALITLRRRKPRRLSTAAIVEGAGSWSSL